MVVGTDLTRTMFVFAAFQDFSLLQLAILSLRHGAVCVLVLWWPPLQARRCVWVELASDDVGQQLPEKVHRCCQLVYVVRPDGLPQSA
jgi:hypothetical protein